MSDLELQHDTGIATITMSRGKVNALDIDEFVEIWYSPSTRTALQGIQIRR